MEIQGLYRCRSCGKKLAQGDGAETSTIQRNGREFLRIVLTCTNPRCKSFKKSYEYDIPKDAHWRR